MNRLSLRTCLIAFVLFIVLPILGLLVYTDREARNEEEQHGRDNAKRVARLAADQQQHLLESTQQLLFLVVRLPVVRAGDEEACRSLFAILLKQYPGHANFGVVDLEGNIVASGVPLTEAINASDFPWFQRLVQNPDMAPGDCHVDRVTGKPVLVVSHPVLDLDGRLKFVAFAALDLTWSNKIMTTAQLPPGSVLTVSDSEGMIVARSLEAAKWAGTTAPEASVMKSIPPQRDATVEAHGVDGVHRVYAFTQLYRRADQPNAHMSVGIPTTAVYARTNRTLFISALGLGLASLLGLMVAWVGTEKLYLHGIRRLEETTRRLDAGHLSARAGLQTGTVELRQLARSFDQMAESYERCIAEARHTEFVLQEKEMHLRRLVNQIPALIWTTDSHLRITASLGAGLAPAKSRTMAEEGTSLEKFFQTITPGRAPVALHQQALQGQHAKAEIDLADGNAQIQLEPLRDPEGKIIGCIGVAFDTSERRRMELELRESESQQNLALDATLKKLAEHKRAEEALHERERQLKRALRSAVMDVTARKGLEETLRERGRQLKLALDQSSEDLARLKRGEEAPHGGEQRLRISLHAANTEISSLRKTQDQLRAYERELKLALETADSHIDELRAAHEKLLENERQLRPALEAAHTRIAEYKAEIETLRNNQRQLEAALTDATAEISHHRQAAEALRQSEKHLSLALDAAHSALAMHRQADGGGQEAPRDTT